MFFAWASVTKLRDIGETIADFQRLGLPRIAARLVPVAELTLAVGFLVFPGWAAVFAFFLLAAFTSLLFTLVRQGSSQPCRCFGHVNSGPVSMVDIARNFFLLALAIGVSTLDRLYRPTFLDVVVVGGTTLLVAWTTIGFKPAAKAN